MADIAVISVTSHACFTYTVVSSSIVPSGIDSTLLGVKRAYVSSLWTYCLVCRDQELALLLRSARVVCRVDTGDLGCSSPTAASTFKILLAHQEHYDYQYTSVTICVSTFGSVLPYLFSWIRDRCYGFGQWRLLDFIGSVRPGCAERMEET